MDIRLHICDICGNKFSKPESVRNDITIVNGDHSGLWKNVCDSCVKKVYEHIQELIREPSGITTKD